MIGSKGWVCRAVVGSGRSQSGLVEAFGLKPDCGAVSRGWPQLGPSELFFFFAAVTKSLKGPMQQAGLRCRHVNLFTVQALFFWIAITPNPDGFTLCIHTMQTLCSNHTVTASPLDEFAQ